MSKKNTLNNDMEFESDLIQSLRVERALQNAKELEEQIKLKKIKPRRPLPYSTESGDQFFYVSPRSQIIQNFNNSRAIGSILVQHENDISSSYDNSIKNIETPIIPKLNLKLDNLFDTPFPNEPSARISFITPSEIESHLKTIQDSLNFNTQLIKQIDSFCSRFSKVTYPALRKKVEHIENTKNEFISTHIEPTKSKNANDQIIHTKLIKDQKKIIISSANEITSSLSDMASKIDALNPKINAFPDTSLSKIYEIRSSQGKIQNSISYLLAKISEHEVKGIDIQADVIRLNHAFDTIDSNIDLDLMTIQADSKSYASILNAISQNIQKEVNAREAFFLSLQKKIEGLQTSCIHSLKESKGAIETTLLTMKGSMQTLTNSIEDALSSISIDVNQMIINTNSSLDTLISETEENTSSFQTELLNTIKLFKNSINSSNQSLSDTIININNDGIKNTDDILTHFDNFEKAIENEIIIQSDYRNELFSDVISKSTDAIKEEYSIFKFIDDAESKLSQIETFFKSTTTSISDTINRLEDNLTTTYKSMNDIKSTYFEKYNEVDKRIELFKGKPNSHNKAFKPEIEALLLLNKTHFNDLEQKLLTKLDFIQTHLYLLPKIPVSKMKKCLEIKKEQELKIKQRRAQKIIQEVQRKAKQKQKIIDHQANQKPIKEPNHNLQNLKAKRPQFHHYNPKYSTKSNIPRCANVT